MMTEPVEMQVDEPDPTSEQDLSGTQLPDAVTRRLSDALTKIDSLEKANRHLEFQKANVLATSQSLQYTVANLAVNNDFARFRAERNHQRYADSVKSRYLSSETAQLTMAQNQIQQLLALLGEERDLTLDLQQRLDHETIVSQAIEIGAEALRESSQNALEAVDELRLQKQQMLNQIFNLEAVCGERSERIASVEKELQKVKSVSPESQGSADMELVGVSHTNEDGSSKVSSPGQTRPKGHAVFLIDGNHHQFTREAIYDLGGDLTAKILIEGVQSLMEDKQIHLRVAIYADKDQLAESMASNQTLHHPRDFLEFEHSFNSVSPWTEFIDTKSTDHIFEMLKLYLEDPTCEFILIGGKMTESFKRLAHQYKDIRRRLYVFSKANPKSLIQPKSEEYKLINPMGHMFQEDRPAPLARSQIQHGPVTFDQHGRRVDPRLYTTQSLINLVTSWKLCNNHYLIGICRYDRCHHCHNRQLTQEHLETLAFLGRSLVCRNGPACEDPTCYAGHICPRQTCDGQQCKFPRDQHLEGTIKAPEPVNPFSTSPRGDTQLASTVSMSSPARGRTILSPRARTSNARMNSPGTVATHWSRMRDEQEPHEDRRELFPGRQSSRRQY